MDSTAIQPSWSFRCFFLRPFFVLTIWLTSILLAVVIGEDPGHFNAIRLMGMIGAVVVVGMPLIALMMAITIPFFTTEVNSTRIRGSSFWGWYFDQEWNDIAAVRSINMFGLPYLRLSSKTSRKTMLIPLFLRDIEHFWGLAVEFTNLDNPLHQFALTRLKSGSNDTTKIRYHYH